jgi:hypothetical protein
VLLPLCVLACGGTGGTGSSTAAKSTPTAKPIVMTMDAVAASGAQGSAEVVKSGGSFDLTLKLKGLAPNSIHVAHIHKGTCQKSGAITFALQPVVAGPNGEANVRTTVPTQYAPPAEGWYANVHNGPDLTTPANAAAVSCGNLTAAA